MQGRADSRKNCFDLNQFYDNLSRIESSLGKAPTRPLTPSHSKNNNPRPKEDEPHNHLAAFKKELHAKTLTKAKIKLDQPYERLRIAPSGLHEEVSNTSDTFKLSELHTRKASEDPFERVRNKLLSWKNQSRKA